MTSQTWSSAKERLIRLIARVIVSTGMLSLLLAAASRWRVTQQAILHPTFPFVRRRRQVSYQILRYHRVNDEHDPFFGAVPVNLFTRQMEMLARYFTVLPLQDLVERAEGNDIPPKAVAITFDDGYRDNYEHAFPILKELGMPATIFLATGWLDSRVPLWHDVLFDALRRTSAESVSFEGRLYPLRSVADKRIALYGLRQQLRKYTPPGRNGPIRELTQSLGLPEQLPLIAHNLNWCEIQEMSQNRITFGAHTVTHPILTSLPLADAAHEITASKEAIERHLRDPVRLFAYPNGTRDDFSEPIKDVLRETGFLCAVTIIRGTNDRETDPFELRRVSAPDSDPRLSCLKLAWYKFIS